jgi:predicted dinucleotide-binding enzyme
MSTLKVGVLGTGDAGVTMATGCLGLGYEVKVGARDAGNPKAAAWATQNGERASAGSFADAASFANVVIVAVRGSAAEDAVRSAGVANFKGKLVIDLTNPLELSDGQPAKLFTGPDDSLGERVQRLLPESRVVKAFNTVGANLFVKPDFGSEKPDMFLAGNDLEAKRIVSGLCNKWNWRPIDLGGIEAARILEPLVLLWIAYGKASGKWGHAPRLLGA